MPTASSVPSVNATISALIASTNAFDLDDDDVGARSVSDEEAHANGLKECRVLVKSLVLGMRAVAPCIVACEQVRRII